MADFEKTTPSSHIEDGDGPQFAMPVAPPSRRADASVLVATLRPEAKPFTIHIEERGDGTPIQFSGEGDRAVRVMAAVDMLKQADQQPPRVFVNSPPSPRELGTEYLEPENVGIEIEASDEDPDTLGATATTASQDANAAETLEPDTANKNVSESRASFIKSFVARGMIKGVEVVRERRAAKFTNGRSRGKTRPARTRPAAHETDTDESAETGTQNGKRKFRELSRPKQAIYVGILAAAVIVPNQIQESFTGQPLIDISHPTHPFKGPANRLEKVYNNLPISLW